MPTFGTDQTHEADSLQSDHSPNSNRRNFLKTLGIAGVTLSLAPTQLLAAPAKISLETAPTYSSWLATSHTFRSCVYHFVTVASRENPGLGRRIIRQLEDSELERAPDYHDFHHRYGSNRAFSVKIDHEVFACGNGFLVNLFPYYGIDCTCKSDKDLNGPEMNRLAAASEVEYYGCVLAPAGRRIDARDSDSDHADYEKLRQQHYPNHKADDWALTYRRRLHSVKDKKHYMGYGVEYKDKKSGDMLITPWNV
ncbi:MAG TPA: twin-arginine translocation signal domain-containing protein [Pyrinomonadaceae bacterium]|nr:twin-arginine translocation signal domain-containing protein [Pyrinomonadaceae bacterium]